ncbi:MAG TPA: phosphonate ABC transporter, permease protein PhnE [Haliangium sp.]|nr:phosphonate ABC transporter, permease protein PhnE [Haliangium sp.]
MTPEPGQHDAGARAGSRPAPAWQLRQPYGPRTILILLVCAVVMAVSFTRVELDRAVAQTGDAVGKGLDFVTQAWPLRFENARRVERMIQLGEMRPPGGVAPEESDRAARERWQRMIDPADLPLFSYIEERPSQPHRADSPAEPYYVERFGYLSKCLWLMLDTVEMAIWGTLLAVFLAVPLAIAGARNYTWARWLYVGARGVCSLVRAVPELIVALILVVMYGPGPVAGILALGLHTSGFLGKFFADDIENADPGPQDALRATGGNRIQVLRLAVLPQIMPQVIAYVQYILERNVRTATILGVVGAGGIGFELMARFRNGEYDSVATILLVIFLSVCLLEQATQTLRKKLM